jgi:hypothetical protein
MLGVLQRLGTHKFSLVVGIFIMVGGYCIVRLLRSGDDSLLEFEGRFRSFNGGLLLFLFYKKVDPDAYNVYVNCMKSFSTKSNKRVVKVRRPVPL